MINDTKTKSSKKLIRHLKTFLLFLIVQLLSIAVSAQNKIDSIKLLNEIKVTAYLSEQVLLKTPTTVSVVSKNQLQLNSSNSLLPTLNAVSGVKMEERSPGSYRLSIRGSLLRSPFGVRNIKVYFDGLPLTDASGNTYLNLIDQAGIEQIEILKGPDGSLFGANSGGVVLLNSQSKSDEITLSSSVGEYGLIRENIHLQQRHKNYEYSFHQAFQYSEGYRKHSLMQRSFFQTRQKWSYLPKVSLKFSGFYSDLGYQTPGGLTADQWQTSPKMARPSTATVAGSEAQNAAIYNQTFFGGLTHEYRINRYWNHSISFSGMETAFENPFITNFEKRKENSFAIRTFITYQSKAANNFKYDVNFGWEFQNTQTKFRNYKNNGGETGNIISADLIENQSQFIFTRFKFEIGKKLNGELATSLNFSNYNFAALSESSTSTAFGQIDLKKQLMPKLALSYAVTENTILRGLISRGYAIPTKEEIRASDAKINTNLTAEDGWNYELGLRMRTPLEHVFIDFSGFYYRLNNAIVRKVINSDEDNYINAGGTNQKGIEAEIIAQLFKNEKTFIHLIDFKTAITLSNFKFRDYVIVGNNYTGNRLTGVPKTNLATSLNLAFYRDFNFYIQHQFNGKTTLNDAATIFAKSYNLISIQLNWEKQIKNHILNLNIGLNNLLNVDYSLGNDLNAFGGRYFNPAAKRNVFAGFSLRI